MRRISGILFGNSEHFVCCAWNVYVFNLFFFSNGGGHRSSYLEPKSDAEWTEREGGYHYMSCFRQPFSAVHCAFLLFLLRNHRRITLVQSWEAAPVCMFWILMKRNISIENHFLSWIMTWFTLDMCSQESDMVNLPASASLFLQNKRPQLNASFPDQFAASAWIVVC